jgi:hypothetical protein
MNFRMRAAPISTTAIGHTSHTHSTDSGDRPATTGTRRNLVSDPHGAPTIIGRGSRQHVKPRGGRCPCHLPPVREHRSQASDSSLRCRIRVANSQEGTTSWNIPRSWSSTSSNGSSTPGRITPWPRTLRPQRRPAAGSVRRTSNDLRHRRPRPPSPTSASAARPPAPTLSRDVPSPDRPGSSASSHYSYRLRSLQCAIAHPGVLVLAADHDAR